MLLSSSVRQPIRRAGPEGNHSNDRVNAGDRQYCYDVFDAWRLQVCERTACNREPAYFYDTGAHLAAVWAPVLEPSDASDPRFGELIGNGRQFKIKDLHLRNAQQLPQIF
jgi:hypothetical protein